MVRSYPLPKAKILMDQAYGCLIRAAEFVSQAVNLEGEFKTFRSPRGMIQLGIENNTMNLLDMVEFAGTPVGIRIPTYVQEEIARGLAEFVTHENTVFSMGVIGLPLVGGFYF